LVSAGNPTNYYDDLTEGGYYKLDATGVGSKEDSENLTKCGASTQLGAALLRHRGLAQASSVASSPSLQSWNDRFQKLLDAQDSSQKFSGLLSLAHNFEKAAVAYGSLHMLPTICSLKKLKAVS
jgi:hypothetical protein